MDAANMIIQSFARLMGGPLIEALGKSRSPEEAGSPGDADLLEFVAHNVGEIHRQTIEWGLNWLHVKCKWKEADRLLSIFPRWMSKIQDSISQISDRIDRIYEDALATISPTSPDYKAVLSIELIIPEEDINAVTTEIDRLAPLLAKLG